jgi:hypothetical protein
MAGVKGRSGGHNRKSLDEHRIAGTFRPGRHRGLVIAHPSSGQPTIVAELETIEPPDDMTTGERQVWEQLSPHALSARTLVPATRYAFQRLCGYVALERELAVNPDRRATGDHRGMVRIVDAGLVRFALSPCGRPIPPTENKAPANENPLARFIQRRRVVETPATDDPQMVQPTQE